MALIATLAEATAMHVIGAMATIAGCCHCDFCHGFCGVARMTIEALMGARQRELGLGGMIEPPSRPTVGIMTFGTLGTDAALVVCILMTADTGFGRVLELRGAVALFARDGCVQTDQGKARHIMIEGDFLAPAGFLVTLFTIRTELAFVGVVVLVASRAVGREFIAVEVALMASVAFGCSVFAP